MKKIVAGAVTFATVLASSVPAFAQSSDGDLGTVYTTANTYCPRGTLEANGQLLSIAENNALFSLLGTTYGGNGQQTFALPDMRGRVPRGQGQGPGLASYTQGQRAGSDSVTLTTAQMPIHTHGAATTATAEVHISPTAGDKNTPVRSSIAISPTNGYSSAEPAINQMKAGTVIVNATTNIGVAGGSQPVSVADPYVALRYCIVTQGIYPSRD